MFIFKFENAKSTVLKIGALPGIAGDCRGPLFHGFFSCFFKNIITIQSCFLTFIIKNGQFSLYFTSF